MAVDAVAELGAVDESLQEKMHQWFPGEELPSLYTVLIGVDSRFLSELTHTSALYSELFEPGGRKRLVKVRCALPERVRTAVWTLWNDRKRLVLTVCVKCIPWNDGKYAQ